eukprot:COSAG05_NODE_8452_length_702_cov_0.991708_1_plen_233_part_11
MCWTQIASNPASSPAGNTASAVVWRERYILSIGVGQRGHGLSFPENQMTNLTPGYPAGWQLNESCSKPQPGWHANGYTNRTNYTVYHDCLRTAFPDNRESDWDIPYTIIFLKLFLSTNLFFLVWIGDGAGINVFDTQTGRFGTVSTSSRTEPNLGPAPGCAPGLPLCVLHHSLYQPYARARMHWHNLLCVSGFAREPATAYECVPCVSESVLVCERKLSLCSCVAIGLVSRRA